MSRLDHSLRFAAGKQNITRVKFLIEKGADPKITIKSQRAIDFAVRNFKNDIVKYLIDHAITPLLRHALK